MLVADQVNEIVAELSAERPVFHSEADFQHALAWKMHERIPECAIRLEYPLPWESGRAYADLWVHLPDRRLAIELKYWTKGARLKSGGEDFALANQSALPLSRYDFIKDLARLERAVGGGHADEGIAIAVTNEPGYWKPGRLGGVDADFRLHEGRQLSATLRWSSRTGGTKRGREEDLSLAGDYTIGWKDYSKVGAGPGSEFRSRSLSVGPGLHIG